MKKIPTLFMRDYGTRLVDEDITEGCEWVFEEEDVIATLKHDGTACAIIDGELYKRYDCKKGKNPPEGFIPCQEPDLKTGHYPGWVKVDFTLKENKYHKETWKYKLNLGFEIINGTYELCGPKIQGNPENLGKHVLIKHGCVKFEEFPKSFKGLKEFLNDLNAEGVVFYRKNGDMCKLKKKDFGFKRRS